MAPVSQGEVSEEDAALQEENAALQQRLEALEAELREEKAYAYTVVHGYITDAEMIYMETMDVDRAHLPGAVARGGPRRWLGAQLRGIRRIVQKDKMLAMSGALIAGCVAPRKRGAPEPPSGGGGGDDVPTTGGNGTSSSSTTTTTSASSAVASPPGVSRTWATTTGRVTLKSGQSQRSSCPGRQSRRKRRCQSRWKGAPTSFSYT